MENLVAKNINILGKFCGKRDVDALSAEQLMNTYGMKQADIMVLFGGSILCGGDIMAQAIKDNIAKKYIIVGGAGHTTETLRQRFCIEYPAIITKDLTEAEIFSRYMERKYGVTVDYLECKSTNCGNNITFLLELIKQKKIEFRSIILCQDATMQYRMEATLRKYVSYDVAVINYAVYKANVIGKNNRMKYDSDIFGMWNIGRYVNLLMGEIKRLADNEEGYGPNGKDFIAHVDIPNEVMAAFEELKKEYGENTREANSLYEM